MDKILIALLLGLNVSIAAAEPEPATPPSPAGSPALPVPDKLPAKGQDAWTKPPTHWCKQCLDWRLDCVRKDANGECLQWRSWCAQWSQYPC